MSEQLKIKEVLRNKFKGAVFEEFLGKTVDSWILLFFQENKFSEFFHHQKLRCTFMTINEKHTQDVYGRFTVDSPDILNEISRLFARIN